jgi:hypothetical protein
MQSREEAQKEIVLSLMEEEGIFLEKISAMVGLPIEILSICKKTKLDLLLMKKIGKRIDFP